MTATPPNGPKSTDDLGPEWTEYESRWAVDVADFGGPVDATRFLARRRQIFQAAAALGLSRDLLTPFEPNRPGFEDRVKAGLEAIARAASLAAE